MPHATSAEPPAALRLLRAFTIGWVLLCLLVAGITAWQVAELRQATGALDDAGGALERTGSVIADLSDLPLVGGAVDDAGRAIASAGEDSQAAAETTRRRITILAVLVGLGMAVLPTVPLLVVWRTFEALFRELRP